MKRWIALILTLIAILSLCACNGSTPENPAQAPATGPTISSAPDVTVPDPTVPDATNPTVPDVTDPEGTYDLVYDMNNYEWFSDIFEEKDVEEWNAMGRYTIRLEGLHTPVAVNMDGTSVLSVTAFDQTVVLNAMASDYFDGYSPVNYIRSTKNAVVIRICGGEMYDEFILITANKYVHYPNQRDGHISLWVEEEGTLAYRQTYFDMSLFAQTLYEPLKYLAGRDHVLYDEGRAQIVNGEAVFTPERTVVVSDLFDVDAMFAEAKANGQFVLYETVDELFEANKAGM